MGHSPISRVGDFFFFFIFFFFLLLFIYLFFFFFIKKKSDLFDLNQVKKKLNQIFFLFFTNFLTISSEITFNYKEILP